MNPINQINKQGFSIINNVYNQNEIEKLISLIEDVTERRVIHIEFSRQELPNGLEWSEKMALN